MSRFLVAMAAALLALPARAAYDTGAGSVVP